MTPEAWRRVKEIFAAARERPPSERAHFLDKACGSDPELRAEVESLLSADTSQVLDTGAHSMYADLRAAIAERYRLEREIGRGGMATVFLAHDLKHDRPVALKVLHPDLARALGIERFQREIKLAARLQHPHILSVHDSGESAGLLWFTMPLVEGESLRDRLNREKQLPVDDALRIAREVAEALDYAHRHGVVHRDVKPENILLTESHALVADFGIARALGGTQAPLTGSGVAIGTPAYMSPEQASGMQEVDGRTDVYALGCVLFEMLAGEPPYTGPTPQAIVARALTETPRPIHRMRAGVPEALDAIIVKAMAVTPADRYGSAAEFARAVEPLLHPPSPDGERGKGGEARKRRVLRVLADRPLFAMLAFGFLLGVGVLFAWRRSHGSDDVPGVRRVAVLPFENLGDSADAYFADGMTDAVRGKLSAVPGLEVTARSSSSQYKGSTKSPQLVGRELGVQYLLNANVRWQKGPSGSSRLNVTTELVRAGSGSIKWQQSFDASYSDSLFEIQTAIADRVVQALSVVLGDSTRQRLAERPTQNLAAYDAYLKGDEVSQDFTAADPPTVRRAAAYYAQAVALDSNFVQAWALLSVAHSTLYLNSIPTPSEAELARRAAERAMALGPNRAEGHVALGYYYLYVVKDETRAAEEYAQAQKIVPNDTYVLLSLARTDAGLGRWESALSYFQRWRTLDPRSAFPGGGSLTYVFLSLRRYPEAREEADRVLALYPSNLLAIADRAMVSLGQGDLAGARAVIANAPKDVDPGALVATLANSFDLYWVLERSQQELILQLTPTAWDGNRAVWATVMAETYWLRGDRARAQTYADSAEKAYFEQLLAAPNDGQLHVFRGQALAYLDRKAEAVQEGQRGVALWPMSKDALFGPYIQHQLVLIYILVGEPEKALDQLEPLLKIPYYLSPGWLKIDPNFDPLRSNPRFQKLLSEGS